MIKNNFRILKKQYAYLQTILKTPVKFQKDWPKTVGGVADTRMVVGADGRTDGRTDRRTDGRTDTQNFGGYNIIPRHFLVAGHKNMFSSPYLDTQTKLYFETYSSFSYMMILHFAPNFKKMHFCTTENFLGKILIFENTLITTERQEIQTIYLKKYLGIYIL